MWKTEIKRRYGVRVYLYLEKELEHKSLAAYLDVGA